MDQDLAEQVVDAATRVLASGGGAISANGHSTVGIRLPRSAEAVAKIRAALQRTTVFESAGTADA